MRTIFQPSFSRGSSLLSAAVLAVVAASALANGQGPTATKVEPEMCNAVGVWIDPKTGARLETESLIESVANRPAVLLGESHTNAEDHRWQLHTTAALHGRRANMVLGFEMFPRSVQPALNRWVAGELSEREFLQEARWNEVWGYEAKHYLPLFHFARQNRIPMVALNVDRSLVARVGREGWESVPESEREGLTTPAEASHEYEESLAAVYQQKAQMGGEAEEAARADLEKILGDPDFQRFVAAQLTWDRAMAEALAEASERHAGAIVVGVMGRGHVEFGHGVAHQMNDLGVENTAILLPIAARESCDAIEPGLADAVFLVGEPEAPAPRPLLGVRIEAGEEGVRVASVSEGSVAEQAGIEEGDIIRLAAGFPTKRPGELILVIRRQAPGTWLPLEILRAEESMEIVAKFPSVIEGHPHH